MANLTLNSVLFVQAERVWCSDRLSGYPLDRFVLIGGSAVDIDEQAIETRCDPTFDRSPSIEHAKRQKHQAKANHNRRGPTPFAGAARSIDRPAEPLEPGPGRGREEMAHAHSLIAHQKRLGDDIL